MMTVSNATWLLKNKICCESNPTRRRQHIGVSHRGRKKKAKYDQQFFGLTVSWWCRQPVFEHEPMFFHAFFAAWRGPYSNSGGRRRLVRGCGSSGCGGEFRKTAREGTHHPTPARRCGAGRSLAASAAAVDHGRARRAGV
jgi:hypothetical protein